MITGALIKCSQCARCGAPFESRLRPGIQKYCSRRCQLMGRNRRSQIERGQPYCERCGGPIDNPHNRHKKFCSRHCQNYYKRRANGRRSRRQFDIGSTVVWEHTRPHKRHSARPCVLRGIVTKHKGRTVMVTCCGLTHEVMAIKLRKAAT